MFDQSLAGNWIWTPAHGSFSCRSLKLPCSPTDVVSRSDKLASYVVDVWWVCRLAVINYVQFVISWLFLSYILMARIVAI